MNMGIGKGKSDKIDIDGLIEGVGNENKVAQEESKLEQKIKELKDVRLELEAATRKMEEVTFALKTATDSADNIISGICRAIVKAEQNIVFRAKISTDELAKVHQCTVQHIKKKIYWKGIVTKWPNTSRTMKAFGFPPLGLYLLWSYWRLVILP